MIYGHRFYNLSSDPLDNSEDPSYTELVEPTPEGSEDPLAEDNEEEGDLRSIYEGSISDTILSGFGTYFNEHAAPYARYFIWRESQYVYRMVYGSTSDYVSWSNAQEVVYTANSAYNGVPTFQKGRSGSITLSSSDVGSSSAYVYSSLDTHLPNRYVESDRFLPLLSTILLVTALAYCIYRFVSHALFRRC